MPLVPIYDVGRIGLVTDLPDHELQPEAWTDVQNIRFREGWAEKFTGSEAIYDPPTVAPYWLMPVREPDDHYWIYAGLADVYATDGTTHKRISKSPAAYTATEAKGWTGGILGGVPILNNGVDAPQMWTPVDFATPGLLADLTAWPAGAEAKILRVFRNFLIALDYANGAATRFPHMVKWSHPADPGAVPTSWDETDATVLAGEFNLAEEGGQLVDCRPLGDVNIIYKEGKTFGQQVIGGTLVFRFYTILQELGILSRRCVMALRNRHIVFGFEDIAVHDGRQAESIVERRVKRYIYNNLDATNYGLSFLAVNPREEEIWFCFPTTGAARPDRAAVWKVKDNVWGVRDLPLVSDIKWGVVDDDPSVVWDDDSGVWDADMTAWDSRAFNPTLLGFLGSIPGSTKLYRFDSSNQEAGTNMTVRLQRTGLAIVGRARDGSPRVDLNRMKLCRGVVPKIESTGPVDITVGSQTYRDGAVTWGPTQSFDPATQVKLDTTVFGRLMAIKFESSSDIEWKLYGYDMDIEAVGRF